MNKRHWICCEEIIIAHLKDTVLHIFYPKNKALATGEDGNLMIAMIRRWFINIAVNVPVGTIFSIMRGKAPVTCSRDQLAAGFLLWATNNLIHFCQR